MVLGAAKRSRWDRAPVIRSTDGTVARIGMKNRPDWWEWDLDISPHAWERMKDRRFTEVEIRGMLQRATRIRRDVIAGRWIALARLRGRAWEVVVEPDPETQTVVVITAYPLWP